MKLKKLTLIAALALFALSGAANAMLPMMFLMLGGGMMQGMMGGHGGSAQGTSPAEKHNHAVGKEASGVGGSAVSGEHRHDSATGTTDSVGEAGANRPATEKGAVPAE